MSGQVSRGSAGEYQADEWAGIAQTSWRLLLQMITFGETIELPSSNTDYASPLLPLKNIYLPHVMLLAKTKMRIGKDT